MNRCITKQLTYLSCQYSLTSVPQRKVASHGLSRTIWTMARAQALSCPNSAISKHLRHLYTHLNSVLAQQPHLVNVGGVRRWASWSKLRRNHLSDRNIERCGLALAASWFTMLTVQSECDQVDFDLLVKNKILNPDEEQTGWDRLAAMYTLDEMGGLTPELELVSNIATAGLLVGGSLGAMMNGRLAIVKFVERNQATPFESQIVAKRALQDRVTLGMARGFFMFGWRTALFTSAFALVSTTLMVYTNQISALHYMCGGMTAGALYKANLGLRGMTAGAVAGGLLGLIGGGIFSLTCYLTETTLPKLRYQQYLWKHQQDLRQKARAEKRREHKRLDAEKKLEGEKAALAQSQLQETMALAARSSDSAQEAAAEPITSDRGATVTELDSDSSRSVATDRGGTETMFDAAVAAAAAAVSGTNAQSGETDAAEAS